MKGIVDEELRALLTIRVAANSNAVPQDLTVWIDTAFNGGLVIPKTIIAELKLEQQSSTEAILADGSVVELETYGCSFDWFGTPYHTQVVGNDGRFALLGTILLAGRRLEIDYSAGTVELS